MATAKKTPSGMYKARVYSHTDAAGKKHYRAFTASTKAEAEQLAAQFSGELNRAARVDQTVAEAINGYITAKTGVLSPKTIREYRGMERRCYTSIASERIRRLTNEKLQRFVSDQCEKSSAKTVRNVYALLIASIALYLPDKTFKVTLPARAKKKQSAPNDAQIQALYNASSDWLKLCIALAAFGSMRRGEISALTYGDVDGNVIHVSRDIVQDQHDEWIIKDMPKTADSVRDVVLPSEVIRMIGTGPSDKRIIDKNPNSITLAFIKVRNRIGIDIRFHDLRHYYASIGAYLGVPDIVLASFGGWAKAGSSVMKQVYQNPIMTMSGQYADAMVAHFSALLPKI